MQRGSEGKEWKGVGAVGSAAKVTGGRVPFGRSGSGGAGGRGLFSENNPNLLRVHTQTRLCLCLNESGTEGEKETRRHRVESQTLLGGAYCADMKPW